MSERTRGTQVAVADGSRQASVGAGAAMTTAHRAAEEADEEGSCDWAGLLSQLACSQLAGFWAGLFGLALLACCLSGCACHAWPNAGFACNEQLQLGLDGTAVPCRLAGHAVARTRGCPGSRLERW